MNFYLTGPDGSGKTSLLNYLKKEFEQSNHTVTTIWIRSPKIFSKPLMVYCRMMGYTKYFRVNDTLYGFHDFARSKFVSLVFPYLQYLDLRLVLLFKKTPKGIVFYDRYILDTLADLMVSTQRFDLHHKFIGKCILKLFPSSVFTLVVKVKEETIRARKRDTIYDPNLNLKLKVYEILAEDLNIETLDNNSDFLTTFEVLKRKYLQFNEGMARKD